MEHLKSDPSASLEDRFYELILWLISGDHQLRLVGYPIIYDAFATFEVVGLGISEPSTVGLIGCGMWSQHGLR